jgi:hypothetical protein
MFPLSQSLKFAVGGAIFTLTAAVHSPYADTMTQILGPVGPYAPIMSSVGNKHVVAFFVPGDGRCNVQAVFWNADDVEAKSAAGVRVNLNPAQTISLDSSATETLTLKCGDSAESLSAIDQQVAAK